MSTYGPAAVGVAPLCTVRAPFFRRATVLHPFQFGPACEATSYVGVQLGLWPSCRTGLVYVGGSNCGRYECHADNQLWGRKLLAPRAGLFAAAPRILRCAPDRRRETRRRPTWPVAKLSNRSCFMSAVRIAAGMNVMPKIGCGAENCWLPGTDCSRLRRESSAALRTAAAKRVGVQLGLWPSCRTGLVSCRLFELRPV